MKRILVAAGLAVAACAVSAAEPMMKAGLWEMRIEKQIVDGQDMAGKMAAAQAEMQKAMAGMPAEQRKQMEQMMAGRGMGGAGNPNVHRLCVSPEMAAQDKPVAAGDPKCQPSKYQRSGNRTTFEMNCPGMVGKGESVVSGDSIATTMDMTMTDESGRHTMHSASRLRYVGADCQGIKPADQLAREMQARQKK